jgi:hypothetical protein
VLDAVRRLIGLNGSLESSRAASRKTPGGAIALIGNARVPRVSGTKLPPAFDFTMLRRDDVARLPEICLHSPAGARNIRDLEHGDEVMTPCSLGF